MSAFQNYIDILYNVIILMNMNAYAYACIYISKKSENISSIAFCKLMTY